MYRQKLNVKIVNSKIEKGLLIQEGSYKRMEETGVFKTKGGRKRSRGRPRKTAVGIGKSSREV